MSELSENDVVLIAAYQIGDPTVDEETARAAMSRLDPRNETHALMLGKAMSQAAARYRRTHGHWPAVEWTS